MHHTRLLAVVCSLVSYVEGEAHKPVDVFSFNTQVSTHSFHAQLEY